MSIITEYYKEAELALAAYANLTPGIVDDLYIDALIDDGKGMSAAQAARFASTYTVVGQFTDPGSGLSATVFQQGTTKYLAIRGTEGIFDYVADYFILNGTPSYLNPQYQVLKAKVQEWLGNDTLSSVFTVSGHSLGGYLAAGLLADFSSNISHAYLYNAPGNNSPTSLILQALGVIPTPDASRITSLRADAGTSPIAGLGNDFSQPIPIAIENQLAGVNDPPLSFNHSQKILTDSLAIYDLFARVDPSVSVDTITSIIKAASNRTANTLESALAGLAWVYFKAYSSGEADSRDTFYANLYELQGVIGSNHGTVVSLVGKSREQIASLAKTDIAYRYALKWLDPFVVTGNPGLYTNHNVDGHLNADQFTDLYLQDRAAMLTWKMQFDSGAKDADDLLPGDKSYDVDWDTWSITDDWKFTDVTRGLTLNIDGNGADTHHIVFGSRDGDTITGDSKSDHLYGMDGNDTIFGGAGDDHLEGGRGADVLRGGTGADLMIGGDGMDTYYIDGNDRIRDTGRNFIVYQGQVIAGAFVREGTSNTYSLLGDNNFTLTFDSVAHLTVNTTDSITFDLQTSASAFDNGDFGMRLVETAADPVSMSIAGDLKPIDFSGESGLQMEYDTLNNAIVAPDEPMPDWEDRLYGSPGADLVQGKGGSDALFGREGDDRLYADIEQTISEVYSAGETGVGTGTRGDLLSGDGGDDQLFGEVGNDVLAGGSGDDTIHGGAGDDTIEGDLWFTYASKEFPWSVTRMVTQEGDVRSYSRTYEYVGWEVAAQQGDDFIYAGAGADWVSAQGGNDFVDAGSGDDMAWGEGGADILFGGAGNDELVGDSNGTPASELGDDYLDGGDGNDTLWGGGGGDTLIGGAGDNNDWTWRMAA